MVLVIKVNQRAAEPAACGVRGAVHKEFSLWLLGSTKQPETVPSCKSSQEQVTPSGSRTNVALPVQFTEQSIVHLAQPKAAQLCKEETHTSSLKLLYLQDSLSHAVVYTLLGCNME